MMTMVECVHFHVGCALVYIPCAFLIDCESDSLREQWLLCICCHVWMHVAFCKNGLTSVLKGLVPSWAVELPLTLLWEGSKSSPST